MFKINKTKRILFPIAMIFVLLFSASPVGAAGGGSGASGGDNAIDFESITRNLKPTLGIKDVFLPSSSTSTNVGGIITIILPYLFVIAGLLLLFYLIYGGFHMMIAANDEKGLAEAKGKITNALVGFLLLFISYWLVQILGHIFGIAIF